MQPRFCLDSSGPICCRIQSSCGCKYFAFACNQSMRLVRNASTIVSPRPPTEVTSSLRYSGGIWIPSPIVNGRAAAAGGLAILKERALLLAWYLVPAYPHSLGGLGKLGKVTGVSDGRTQASWELPENASYILARENQTAREANMVRPFFHWRFGCWWFSCRF